MEVMYSKQTAKVDGLGWAGLVRAGLGWSGLVWADPTNCGIAVSKAVLLAPFSQLTLRRAAAGHVPPPAPTERRLPADGHAFSLTVG